MNRPLRLAGFGLSILTVAMVLSAQLSARPALAVAVQFEDAGLSLGKPAKARVGRLADVRRPALQALRETVV